MDKRFPTSLTSNQVYQPRVHVGQYIGDIINGMSFDYEYLLFNDVIWYIPKDKLRCTDNAVNTGLTVKDIKQPEPSNRHLDWMREMLKDC